MYDDSMTSMLTRLGWRLLPAESGLSALALPPLSLGEGSFCWRAIAATGQ